MRFIKHVNNFNSANCKAKQSVCNSPEDIGRPIISRQNFPQSVDTSHSPHTQFIIAPLQDPSPTSYVSFGYLWIHDGPDPVSYHYQKKGHKYRWCSAYRLKRPLRCCLLSLVRFKGHLSMTNRTRAHLFGGHQVTFDDRSLSLRRKNFYKTDQDKDQAAALRPELQSASMPKILPEVTQSNLLVWIQRRAEPFRAKSFSYLKFAFTCN